MPVEDEKAEEEAVNRASALWARPKNEIKPEEYDEFYKHVAHDFEPPLAHVHSRVEGRQEYVSLLYVPKRAPFNLWDRDRKHGVKLYVRRVFVMDDAEQLLPAYLRFVRGVIDSNDLPLNISREILQHSKDIEAIRAGSVKKVLDLLSDTAEKDKEKYATFWGEFGAVFKEGVVEDFGNRQNIARLIRFASTLKDTDVQDVTLADYIARMKPGQSKIYYVTAETFSAAKNSPHLEVFRDKGAEVLLLSDRIDEWVMSHLTEFEGKPIASVAKGGLDLGGLEDKEAQKKQEEIESAHKDLVERVQQALGERVKAVRVTHRLTTSPACLVVDEHDLSVNMSRLLKAAGQSLPQTRPTLEINPAHAIVKRLNDEADAARFADWSQLLFDQALLSEGGQLEDPAAFVRRLNDLLIPA
jgi:molecular chaperone HtpG